MAAGLLAIAVRAHALLAALLVCGMGTVPALSAVSEPDPHANHHVVRAGTQRYLADYKIPDLQLIREDGKAVSLLGEVDDGRPVVLAFIYTSCTSVCPVMSHVLADLQNKLGSARDSVHIMSVSIDPEQDTPARLREYAQRFGAGPEWQHYTGTAAASQAAQRAFGVYRGDKMNHVPAMLVRPLPGAKWVRIDGFASADQVLSELPSYCTAAR